MTTQISLRLGDEVVEWIDQQVGDGVASSRAELVMRALIRERRRLAAEHDVAILRAAADDDGLGGLERVASRLDLSDLD